MKWSELYIKDIKNLQLKAILNVVYTGFRYEKRIKELLTPMGISHQQFEVLKILEEFPSKPFSLKEIQMQLLNQTSNATRLVEKLRLKELLQTSPSKENKSKLDIMITKKGLDLLKKTEHPVKLMMAEIKENLSDDEANEISRVLTKVQDSLDEKEHNVQ
ncbi:MarR family transcriptional regulator [Tenacibaculum sp. Bg11-29]|uniref:MarR family winged helix-turn-helix transcriptional regulator n=1 Tax=Tenacibaculum sp. Bg11-29 TaxID=2058306 RepID=UPI000C33E400|nr:MarR family transcriptional regulator [Tenacibaculum sp. Bg11-29]PKH51789.1 MarR family transcriptional regulator [Tenacibaculum sp. Bg11-29]